MDSYDVRFWDIKRLGPGSAARFRVRWAVDGHEHCKSFKARPLADGFLGAVNEGWTVAMATASSERGLSLRSPARYTEAAGRLVSLYRDQMSDDPQRAARAADAVARAVIDAEAYSLHTYWTATRLLEGGAVGPEASMNKIFWSETDLHIHRTALELLGSSAELVSEDGRPPAWLDGFLFALAGPIYAGTNEIQRNVVAERVLGLPRG